MSRSFDRIIGLASTVAVGSVVLLSIHSWIKRVITENRAKRRKEKGDDVFRSRYSATSSPNNVIHNGSCHCHRVKFRIKTSKVLNAVDIPSKIRYPRVTVSSKNFESLTEDGIMSLYAVKEKGNEYDHITVGVHTFCSFCGIHVFYSPSIDPFEIQVNLDCIDRTNVDKVNISYLGIPESVACPISYEAAGQYNKRGVGCSFSPNINALVPFIEANTPISTVYALTRYGSASNRKYDNHIDNTMHKKPSPTSGFALSNYFNINSTSPENKEYDKENINSNRNTVSNTHTPNKFQYPSFLTPAKYKGSKKALGAKDQNNFLTISTPVQNQLRQHLQHHLPKVTEA